MIATAISERLFQHPTTISINGESYRLKDKKHIAAGCLLVLLGWGTERGTPRTRPFSPFRSVPGHDRREPTFACAAVGEFSPVLRAVEGFS